MIKFFLYKAPKPDLGLLILRALTGIMMVFHGAFKFIRGGDTMEKVGSAVQHIGITGGHELLGYLAASTEILAGILIVTGFFFTPAAIALVIVLAVAAIMKIATGSGFSGFAHPMEMGFVFLSLIFTGPGKYSFDHKISEINADRYPDTK